MNLVQINERLKDLPMQVVQQYANGMNPEVPPYLALGELQRREMSQKQMATAQGASQGPQPSIKEQVEQKAGLMQLQQMQQQQMAQQMQQPRGPMPVPSGAPQPEDQPEVAMASGGLASVPMRPDMFEYASGGIIAFQAGGQPKYETPYDRRNRENREAVQKSAQERVPKAMEVTESSAQALAEAAQARVNELESKREELTRKFGPNMYEQALSKARQQVEAASVRGSELVAQQTQIGQERMAAATPQPAAPFGSKFAPVNPADMMGSPAGLPAALAKAAPTGNMPPAMGGAQPPAAPRPAAQPPVASGLPAALPQPPAQTGAPERAAIPVSPDRAQLEGLMAAQARPAPTAEGIIGDVNALMPAGMQQGAQQKLLADQRARAEARQTSFDKSQPDYMDNIIRVLGQAGQSKGLSGLAPAYTANQDRRRAEDLAFQKQQDELLTAIESRGTAFDKDTFTARTGAMDKAQTLFGQSQRSILEAAAAKLGAEQGRLDKQAQLNMQRDLEEFKAKQDMQLKTMDIGQRERESKRTDARSPAARAAEFVALRQRARDLREKGQTAAADRLDAQAADMGAFGGSGGQGGDRGPTPTDRLRAAQSIMNDIDSTPEEKAMAKKEIAGIMSGSGPVTKPITKAEYDKLPKGATYTAPDGSQRTKG